MKHACSTCGAVFPTLQELVRHLIHGNCTDKENNK